MELLHNPLISNDATTLVKEIGKYLSAIGASKIIPIVIARTVGGDIIKDE